MKNVNWLGLPVAVICSAVSLGLIADYALGASDNPWRVVAYGAVGVVSVLIECTALHRGDHLKRVKRYGAALTCYFGLAIAVLITVSYEIGSLAEIMESKVAIGESRAGERGALEAERSMLLGQVRKTGEVRPVPAIQGDIDAIKAHPRWTSTAGCSNVTSPESKELCSSYGKLAAEIGAATAIAGATARIVELNGQLAPFAGAKFADARASYLSRLTGLPEIDSRIAVAAMLIVLLLYGRVAGVYVYMDARAAVADDHLHHAANMMQISNASHAAKGAPWTGESLPATQASAKTQFLPPAAYYASQEDEFEDESGRLSQEEIIAQWEIEEEQRHLASLKAKTVPLPTAMLDAGGDDADADEGDNGDGTEEAADADDEIDRPSRADLAAYDPHVARRRALVERFASDCLVFVRGDRKTYEKAGVLWDAFQHWCVVMEIEDKIARQHFGQAFNVILGEKGGTRAKWSEIYYVGVSVKPSFAHSMVKAAEVVAVAARDEEPVKVEIPMNERRLGSVLKDRRALAIDAEPAGNA